MKTEKCKKEAKEEFNKPYLKKTAVKYDQYIGKGAESGPNISS